MKWLLVLLLLGPFAVAKSPEAPPAARDFWRVLVKPHATNSDGEVEVCWGWDNATGEECENTCFGHACATAGGVVSPDGTCAPGDDIFHRAVK